MTPSLAEFLNSLDHFVDQAADGRLPYGQRLKLFRLFDEELGNASSARRDLLGALVAQEMFKHWKPCWLDEATFEEDPDGSARHLAEQFACFFSKNLPEMLAPDSPAREEFIEWYREMSGAFDSIAPCLERRAAEIIAFCGVLAERFQGWDQRLENEIIADHKWKSVDGIDPDYDFISDDGPRTIEDGWELFCMHNRYATPEELRPDCRKAWHWWLKQVRLVVDNPQQAQMIVENS
jgi:hypothetical protein